MLEVLRRMRISGAVILLPRERLGNTNTADENGGLHQITLTERERRYGPLTNDTLTRNNVRKAEFPRSLSQPNQTTHTL